MCRHILRITVKMNYGAENFRSLSWKEPTDKFCAILRMKSDFLKLEIEIFRFNVLVPVRKVEQRRATRNKKQKKQFKQKKYPQSKIASHRTSWKNLNQKSDHYNQEEP